MGTKITVKTKIRCNGREYASVGEMPFDMRQAYERALAAKKNQDVLQAGGPSTKIVLNGHEYRDIEEMPADVRQLYEMAIGSATASDNTVGRTRSTFRIALAATSLLGVAILAAWLLIVRS